MMRLQMIQKPPVVFTRYEPERVISQSDWMWSMEAISTDEKISRLWECYAHSVLAAIDACMEANEGISSILTYASKHKPLSLMEVKRTKGGNYELKMGEAILYLSETESGEVYLYFVSSILPANCREENRIDLTAFGSDASAYFIATLFRAYKSIVKYFKTAQLS